MENVSIVLAEGCYTDIGPNSPFYLVTYIKCMMSGRDSERKSWEVRGKLQENSMYLRPLPASSAPANTDAVIPPTFIWNCLSVCRSWTNSVLLKKMTPFKHITKAYTVFTDATKNVSEIQDKELSFLLLCRIFFHWEQNDKVQGQKTKSSNIRTCKSLRLNCLWELQGQLKQLSYLRNMIYNMFMYLMIFPQLKKRFFVFPLHYSVRRKQNCC